MSIYSEFLDDAKEVLSDMGIEAVIAGSQNLAMLSDPMSMPTLGAGGFTERKNWTVRLAASTAPWMALDGRVGASVALISGGAPIATLGEGKKLTINGQLMRIVGTSYKRGSAWITLQVIDDSQ